MSSKFSVIIPLYNKEAEVGRAIESAMRQTCAPAEIIVVDDGSTDGSAAVVEAIGSPLMKLIRQPNAGVSAARNRGMAEARGDCYAFLDADDEWRPGFLEKIAAMMETWPACGLYCTGFDVVRGGRSHPAAQPTREGVVENYFGQAMSLYIASGSSTAVPAEAIKKLGGFPEGMKLAEDQYMWTKIALSCPVCFTPERLVKVHTSAANRSAAIYTPERTAHTMRDFLDADNPALNEYIARVELGKAIAATARGGSEEGKRAERDFVSNSRSRRLWRRLWLLNRLPAGWRPIVNNAYNRLAWAISKKGL